MKLLKKIGVTAALALTAQMASATPVTNWNWSLDSAFHTWTGATVVGSGDVYDNGIPSAHIGVDTLTWGVDVGNGQSSLHITNPNLTTANGTATPFSLAETSPGSGVYTDTVSGTLGIHENRPIAVGSALTSFVLREFFRLVPADVDPAADPAGTSPEMTVFMASFWETPNVGDPSCCDDIFVIQDGSTLGMVVEFELDDYDYTVSISTMGLGLLTDEQCIAAGFDPGCAGLVTEENASNEFQFMITLTAVAVSEPSLLALMGLGLIGVAIRRRRRIA